MKNKTKTLLKSAINLVNNYNLAQPLELQAQSQNVLKNLDLKVQDFGFIQHKNHEAIGIRNLLQHPLLRLTIYYLPLGITMKLHDHNEMKVISKVLKGRMQAKLYKHQQLNIYQKSIRILEKEQVMFIDGNKSYNLHQFKALQPTYFLDIIFPDYSSQNDCRFFQQTEQLNEKTIKLSQIKGIEVIFQEM